MIEGKLRGQKVWFWTQGNRTIAWQPQRKKKEKKAIVGILWTVNNSKVPLWIYVDCENDHKCVKSAFPLCLTAWGGPCLQRKHKQRQADTIAYSIHEVLRSCVLDSVMEIVGHGQAKSRLRSALAIFGQGVGCRREREGRRCDKGLLVFKNISWLL